MEKIDECFDAFEFLTDSTNLGSYDRPDEFHQRVPPKISLEKGNPPTLPPHLLQVWNFDLFVCLFVVVVVVAVDVL